MPVPITCSFGIADLSTCTEKDIVSCADAALYRAKQNGRNRVEVHGNDAGAEDSSIRLLIADDDPSIRLTLTALLQREPGFDLVGEAEDAAQAIDLAARRRPNVVVLDFDMPGGGGVRAAIEIREASPTTRIVALSADDSQAAQYDMSRAGAIGYVVKGGADEDIIRAIRNAARW
jgi:PleD family two-component response regulator